MTLTSVRDIIIKTGWYYRFRVIKKYHGREGSWGKLWSNTQVNWEAIIKWGSLKKWNWVFQDYA